MKTTTTCCLKKTGTAAYRVRMALAVALATLGASADCTLIPMPREVAPRTGAYLSTEGAEMVGVKRLADAAIPAEGYRMVIDLQANRTVDPATFKSLSRNMPYAGLTFSAWSIATGKLI